MPQEKKETHFIPYTISLYILKSAAIDLCTVVTFLFIFYLTSRPSFQGILNTYQVAFPGIL